MQLHQQVFASYSTPLATEEASGSTVPASGTSFTASMLTPLPPMPSAPTGMPLPCVSVPVSSAAATPTGPPADHPSAPPTKPGNVSGLGAPASSASGSQPATLLPSWQEPTTFQRPDIHDIIAKAVTASISGVFSQMHGTSLLMFPRIRFHDFAGDTSENPEDWLTDFRIAGQTVNATDAELLRQAPSFLRADAMRWWSNVCRSSTYNQLTYTWDHFRQGLLSQFQHPKPADQARDELAEFRQTGTVQAYTIKFRSLALQAGDCSDAELRHRFMMGLKPALRTYVLRKREFLPTLDDVIKCAITEDSIRYTTKRGSTSSSSGQRSSAAQFLQLPSSRNTGSPNSRSFCGSASSSNSSFQRNVPYRPPGISHSLHQQQRQPLLPVHREHLECLHPELKCSHCEQTGHSARDCPQRSASTALNSLTNAMLIFGGDMNSIQPMITIHTNMRQQFKCIISNVQCLHTATYIVQRLHTVACTSAHNVYDARTNLDCLNHAHLQRPINRVRFSDTQPTLRS